MQPRATYEDYCEAGCVAGLGFIVESTNDDYMRVSVALGYSGVEMAMSAAHELGHNHGRAHAPCGGAQGVDGGYPYDGGVIGVWGADTDALALKRDTLAKDMMGYCFLPWVSDYTYFALRSRMNAVNNALRGRSA